TSPPAALLVFWLSTGAWPRTRLAWPMAWAWALADLISLVRSVAPRTRYSSASCMAPASADASASQPSWHRARASTDVSTARVTRPRITGSRIPNRTAAIPRRRSAAHRTGNLGTRITHLGSLQGFSLLIVADAFTEAVFRKNGVPSQLTFLYGTLKLMVT